MGDFLISFRIVQFPRESFAIFRTAPYPHLYVFALPADGGAMRRLTDFGSRSVLITRRISWSPDSKYIYAAVADVDSDVVLLHGLLR